MVCTIFSESLQLYSKGITVWCTGHGSTSFAGLGASSLTHPTLAYNLAILLVQKGPQQSEDVEC